MTAGALACSLANFHCQEADRHKFIIYAKHQKFILSLYNDCRNSCTFIG